MELDVCEVQNRHIGQTESPPLVWDTPRGEESSIQSPPQSRLVLMRRHKMLYIAVENKFAPIFFFFLQL